MVAAYSANHPTILGSTIARHYVEEITCEVYKLSLKPKVVGKTYELLGFEYELKEVDNYELEASMISANKDDSVHGIMVYFPVFGDKQDQYLQQLISPEKDVGGSHFIYYHNLYHNVRFLDPTTNEQKSVLPCKPLVMVKILDYLGAHNKYLHYGNRLYGKKLFVVNRSEIEGRPVAALLANDGYTVYSLDINNMQKFTRGDDLPMQRHKVADLGSQEYSLEIAPQCDKNITSVPSDRYKFLTGLVSNGTMVLNFFSAKNFDDSIKQKAGLYVPSIAKVTVSMLLRNLLRLICNGEIHERAKK